ncbi:MAG TPA: MFS transporter, partial [Chloroflexota bacterium]|nr:MFS transporter [Chloroflexota bacterium]
MSNLPGSLWRQADFVKVLTGETVSDVGSRIGELALALAAAIALQATPGQMATLRAAEYLPRILVGLVAGVWVDRLRRRPVLLATNVVRAALLVLVAATAALGLLRVELLYVVGVAMAALGIVFNTALTAYLPTLV